MGNSFSVHFFGIEKEELEELRNYLTTEGYRDESAPSGLEKFLLEFDGRNSRDIDVYLERSSDVTPVTVYPTFYKYFYADDDTTDEEASRRFHELLDTLKKLVEIASPEKVVGIMEYSMDHEVGKEKFYQGEFEPLNTPYTVLFERKSNLDEKEAKDREEFREEFEEYLIFTSKPDSRWRFNQ